MPSVNGHKFAVGDTNPVRGLEVLLVLEAGLLIVRQDPIPGDSASVVGFMDWCNPVLQETWEHEQKA
jgi:hypothetical protein